MLRLTICVFKGTLLKHIEEHTLQGDMKASDILFYYTSVSANWVISGEAGLTIVLLIYQPTHFILYLLGKIMIFTTFCFHGNCCHLRFCGTHQSACNIKTTPSNAVKRCSHTHRRHIDEETCTRFLVLLNNRITDF